MFFRSIFMKSFRAFDRHQTLLLPPDLQEWLPQDHLARCVADVLEVLDLSAIFAGYAGDGRGQAAYHPQMMAGLLIYGYCTGVFSSRRMERATFDDVAFRYLSADQHPDHDTIAAFRERHLVALQGLFVQVLQVCEQAGLVQLGHVALDGTKVQANASRHKAMSYGRMCEREKALAEKIAALMAQASAVDAAEDRQYGVGVRAEVLPAELARAEKRLEAIRTAKAALEATAREAAAARKAAATAEHAAPGQTPAPSDPADVLPRDKDQRNFTDPESKIMKTSGGNGFQQAYNAQIVVESSHQVIIANDLTTQGNDYHQLVPMLIHITTNLGRAPIAASADSGYYADSQLTDPRLHNIDLYIPPKRPKHHQPPPDIAPPNPEPETKPKIKPNPEPDPNPEPETAQTRITAMRNKLNTTAGHNLYRMRKAIVEPVFGHIKHIRGFRRFSLRGKHKTTAEWRHHPQHPQTLANRLETHLKPQTGRPAPPANPSSHTPSQPAGLFF